MNTEADRERLVEHSDSSCSDSSEENNGGTDAENEEEENEEIENEEEIDTAKPPLKRGVY